MGQRKKKPCSSRLQASALDRGSFSKGRVDRMVVDFPSAVLALQGGKPTACGGLAADLVVQGLAVDHLEGQADDTLVVAVLGNLSFLVDADRVDLIVVLSVLQEGALLGVVGLDVGVVDGERTQRYRDGGCDGQSTYVLGLHWRGLLRLAEK